MKLVGVFQSNGLVMPRSAVREALSHWQRYLAITHDMEDLHTPKRYLLAHLVVESYRLGNPRFYANWHDESLNKVLKGACRGISQTTFESSLLLRMPALVPQRRS